MTSDLAGSMHEGERSILTFSEQVLEDQAKPFTLLVVVEVGLQHVLNVCCGHITRPQHIF